MMKKILLITLIIYTATSSVFAAYPKRGWIRLSTLAYGTDPAANNFIGRKFDLSDGGTIGTIKAADPNTKVLVYYTINASRMTNSRGSGITTQLPATVWDGQTFNGTGGLNNYFDDTSLVSRFCKMKLKEPAHQNHQDSVGVYVVDSFYIVATANLTLTFSYFGVSYPITTSANQVVTFDGGDGATVGHARFVRKAWNFLKPATGEYMTYKALVCLDSLGNSFDGLFEDEANWYEQPRCYWSGKMYPFGGLTQFTTNPFYSIRGWEGINPATGLNYTFKQVRDSLIYLKRYGWGKAMADSLNLRGDLYFPNPATYGTWPYTNDNVYPPNCGTAQTGEPTPFPLENSAVFSDMAVYGVGDWYGEYAAMSPTYTSYLSDAWRTMDSLGTANYTGTGKEVAFWYYLQRTDMQNYGLARTQLFDLTHYYMAANPTNCYFFIKQNFSKHHNSNDFYAQAYPTYTLTGTYGYTIADTLWSDTTISYLAAMEADIGSPSGFRTQPTSGVWVRQYTKGIVVLNMNSSGSAYLSLGGTYSPVNADGTYGASVSSTTIPYKTGQIFISTTIHPTIWIGGGSAVEGDSISLTITTDSIPTVPVIYQLGITAGTATEGASCAVGVDYITRSITDTIAIGNMSKTVKVATCQDISGEASETFTMTLSNVSPSTINISTPTATGTITDNDTTLRVFSATAVEGQSVSFLVTMNRSISVPVTFRVMTFQDIGSAISGVDFTAVDSTFSIPAGYTSIYIPVQTIDDALSESTEHFSLFLYPPSVGHIEAGYETATGYIVDNDAAGPSGTAKHFPHWKKKI